MNTETISLAADLTLRMPSTTSEVHFWRVTPYKPSGEPCRVQSSEGSRASDGWGGETFIFPQPRRIGNVWIEGAATAKRKREALRVAVRTIASAGYITAETETAALAALA